MKPVLLWTASVFGFVCVLWAQVASPPLRAGSPQYTKDNQLMRPEGYREWVYLSSGFGMAYGARGNVTFTNVFVLPSAYREFMASGKWPDKTVFVVEDRMASSQGSINKGGHFQTDLTGIGVEVKDENRFPDKWAYYNFGPDTKVSTANAKAACWQCHNDHGAVENTFVQFYPTLKPVARHFGTYRESVDDATQNPNSP